MKVFEPKRLFSEVFSRQVFLSSTKWLLLDCLFQNVHGSGIPNGHGPHNTTLYLEKRERLNENEWQARVEAKRPFIVRRTEALRPPLDDPLSRFVISVFNIEAEVFDIKGTTPDLFWPFFQTHTYTCASECCITIFFRSVHNSHFYPNSNVG